MGFKITLADKRKIRKIKFLEKCVLGKDKLVFEFGDIYKQFQYKKVLLGNYRVEITFSEYNRHRIKVFNNNPIIRKSSCNCCPDTKLNHPHVLHNEPCLGYSREKIIKDCLSNGNYIQVIIQFLQFLKTYTYNDCYNDMSYWAYIDTNENGERIYNG